LAGGSSLRGDLVQGHTEHIVYVHRKSWI
jgi:hypothetical protein